MREEIENTCDIEELKVLSKRCKKSAIIGTVISLISAAACITLGYVFDSGAPVDTSFRQNVVLPLTTGTFIGAMGGGLYVLDRYTAKHKADEKIMSLSKE